jgi:glycosyltransferase involved in cell wall biosynthesis
LNKKLRIAIIGSRGYPYVYSGYETLVKELAERFVKRGHSVRVYCHSSLFKKKPKNIKGIELVYTPSIETKFLSQFINTFFSTLHFCFSKYDRAIYLNSANGPFGIFTKIFNKRTIINVDGLEWLRPKWKGLGSIYFKISSKAATIFFDKIITDSDEMKKIYLEIFKCDSAVIAYGAYITKSKKKDLLYNFSLIPRQYLLVVGRLIPDNNADIIINEFLKSNSKKKLVIVGDDKFNGKYSKNLKLNDSSRIIFTGYVNDKELLSQLYQNCYLYIHGHEFGGTNPTLIKALSYGCSIIALDTVFNREVLRNNSFGLYFNKEKNSLKNLINDCLNNSKKMSLMRNMSKDALNAKYDWDCIAEKYINELKIN